MSTTRNEQIGRSEYATRRRRALDANRAMGWFAMAQVAVRLVGLVVIVIVARSTEDFGRYSVALALSSMLTIPVESGMGGYLVREGTQHPERLGVVLGHAMVLRGALAVLGVAGAGLLVGYLLGYDAETLLLTVGTARRFW